MNTVGITLFVVKISKQAETNLKHAVKMPLHH